MTKHENFISNESIFLGSNQKEVNTNNIAIASAKHLQDILALFYLTL